MFNAVEISMFKIFKIFEIVLFIIKWLKSFCCYNSHEVLYGDCIYSLYVDAHGGGRSMWRVWGRGEVCTGF